jgi:WD40 repeat protein
MSSTRLPECQSFSLSADAALLACTTGDDVSLWDLSTQTQLWSKPVPAVEAYFNEVAGELILVGVGIENQAITMNIEDGGLRYSSEGIVPGKFILAMDGSEFLTLMHERIYRGSEMIPIGRICAQDKPATAGHALSGGRYAIICPDNVMKIYKDGEYLSSTLLDLPDDFGNNASKAVLSRDERYLFVGSLKGSVTKIDLQRNAVVHVSQTNLGGIEELAMSPDGRILAISGERDGVWLWHVESGNSMGRLPTKRVHQLRFTSDEELIIIEDQHRKWFLPKTLQPSKFATSSGISSLAFSPDSTMVVAGDGMGQAHVWSIVGERRKVGVPHQTAQVGVTKDCAFTPDGKYLVATTMKNPGVQSYRTDDWEHNSTLQPGKWSESFPFFRRLGALRGGLVYGLGYNPSGPDVWRLGQEGTLEHLRVPGRLFWEGESNHAGTAAVLLDDEDRVYRLTDEPALEVVTLGKGLSAADISNDSKRIALATKHTISVVSSKNGEVMRTIDVTGGIVLDVSFSADDRYLAVGLTSGEARIFSAQTGELLAVLSGHSERVVTVDFSPDGRWLATGSWDATLYLWSLAALDAPVDELSKEIGTAWQMSIEEALSTTIH